MRKIVQTFPFALLLFALLVFSNAKPIYAQGLRTNDRTDRRTPTQRERMREMREENIEQRTSTEARLREVRFEHIRLFWVKMKTRLFALLTRLERITQRIEVRLNKIETSTENREEVAEIKENLSQAKLKMRETGAAINDLDEKLPEILTTDNPRMAFATLRTEIVFIKDLLKEAHRLLVVVVSDLKGFRAENSQ